MKEAEGIIKDIKNKKFAPIYLLEGDEPYYIDLVTKELQNNVLTEEEKSFNQHIFYGLELTDVDQLIGQAKQYPMMSQHQLVIVKEAQNLHKNIDDLERYVALPLESTILVLNYNFKNLDKRKKVYKLIKKNGVVLSTKKLYENKIPDWIDQKVKDHNLTIQPKAKFLLAAHLGNELSRIINEIEKLKVIIGEGKEITPEVIEANIGISKDYNTFELNDAIMKKEENKAFAISKHFGQNAKEHSIFMSLAVFFNLFSNLMIYHTLPDKSSSAVASALRINPYFVKDYAIGSKNYPLKKVTQIISHLREADITTKGVGNTGSMSEKDIMDTLLYKIFNA